MPSGALPVEGKMSLVPHRHPQSEGSFVPGSKKLTVRVGEPTVLLVGHLLSTRCLVCHLILTGTPRFVLLLLYFTDDGKRFRGIKFAAEVHLASKRQNPWALRMVHVLGRQRTALPGFGTSSDLLSDHPPSSRGAGIQPHELLKHR